MILAKPALLTTDKKNSLTFSGALSNVQIADSRTTLLTENGLLQSGFEASNFGETILSNRHLIASSSEDSLGLHAAHDHGDS